MGEPEMTHLLQVLRNTQQCCSSVLPRILTLQNVVHRRDQTMPSSDLAAFRKIYQDAKHVVILTGAGVSAESGVPTFRGAGGFWKEYVAQDLATPQAFRRDPSLVWEFYHYRREVMLEKQPNPAHVAIAQAEQQLKQDGKRLVVITQNIDELHKRAGTQNLLELHGSLFRTLCTECGDVTENYDSPICEALRDKGKPDPKTPSAKIPVSQLPKCSKCSGLLRPAVIWFGESLDDNVTDDAMTELESCDLCLIVGTSSVVYPAAMYAPMVAARGVPVAEFNMEETPKTGDFHFHFKGPCGTTLPSVLKSPSA